VKGVERRRNRHAETLLVELLNRYEPGALVVDDANGERSRRSLRARRLVELAARLAADRRIPRRRFSRSRVRAAFLQTGAFTKHQIAATIAERLSVLQLFMPPVRKPWMSEDYRMPIFDAVALAFTYFDLERKRAKAA
jgi:Holliday junction resolvasome RuvABC endonuclease subunit